MQDINKPQSALKGPGPQHPAGASAAYQGGLTEKELPVAFGLGDLIAVTARLAQLLAQEVDHLDAMDMKAIEKMQDEKRQLTRSVVLMKRELSRRPEMMAVATAEEKGTFKQIAELFEEVLEENHARLLVAKELNECVVRAISDVVHEESMRAGYNKRGVKSQQQYTTPSVSLNQTI